MLLFYGLLGYLLLTLWHYNVEVLGVLLIRPPPPTHTHTHTHTHNHPPTHPSPPTPHTHTQPSTTQIVSLLILLKAVVQVIAASHSRLLPICDAFFIQRGHRRSFPNRGGERRWPQNKTGVVHRYQATVPRLPSWPRVWPGILSST